MHIFFSILLLIFFFNSASQPVEDTNKTLGQIKEAFDTFRQNQDETGAQFEQLSDEQFKTDIALERQKQREIEDENYAIQHRWRSFDFQYTSSIVIFILVIIIVLSGLIFSALQFRIAMHQMQLKEAVIKVAEKKPEKILTSTGLEAGTQFQKDSELQEGISKNLHDLKNELEVSTSGIKVNSSVLGVIILVISIVFFYLYILYVYPIKYLYITPLSQKSDTTTVKTNK